MTNGTRSYSQKTIKLLFANSGNLCAFPGCTTPLTLPATNESDPAVLAQICHIYAASDNGPRGRPNLTDEERNAYENLILFCGVHHTTVDQQHETYPATTLQAWKAEHEAKFQQAAVVAEQRQAAVAASAFVQRMSDQQIEQEILRLKGARFLVGFPAKQAAQTLATKIYQTELTGGSSLIRARGLAWCARVLALGDTVDEARQLVAKSRTIHPSDEAAIADAFITSYADKNAALASLAAIKSAAARTAALQIVIIHDKREGALDWVSRAGLNLGDFDGDGKLLVAINELDLGRWDDAFRHIAELTEADCAETPVLLHVVAMGHLTQAVPEEYRSLVLAQIPIEASDFPLASDHAAMVARNKAIEFFDRSAAAARNFGVDTAANIESDYALWLRLRDPQAHKLAIDELKESLRDPRNSLRRVNLAVRFGITLNVEAVEEEIDRRTALAGKGTADEAFARFALCFAQSDPRAAAAYIAKHREQLYEHLHKPSIQLIEVELLARSGQSATANEKLAAAVADGLGEREQQHLRRIIAESQGADPVAERKALYLETGHLRDLTNLAEVLEKNQAWEELAHFATILFEKTKSLEDALRLARALDEHRQYRQLLNFLGEHPELRAQSPILKTLWAWSLYRQGRFGEAEIALQELVKERNDENDRRLSVNLAITSGNWDKLTDFTNDAWQQRGARTAKDLLFAGQIAQAVSAPHGKDLIKAATDVAPDDPHILAAAYFEASGGGWENDSSASKWLQTAAALSGENGPLKSVPMEELFRLKPEWDRKESDVFRQLNEGKLPMFGVAFALNRSLTDFTLLPSLANPDERDPRRRGIIYSFSGKRAVWERPSFRSIALDVTALFTLARLKILDSTIQHYDKIIVPHSTLNWLFQDRQRVVFHQPSRIRDARQVSHLVMTGALRVLEAAPLRNHALVSEVGEDLARLLEKAVEQADTKDRTPRFVVRSSPVPRLGSLMGEEATLVDYESCLCSCRSMVSALRAKAMLTLEEEQMAASYLTLHERSWPSEPTIPDGAELYLDNLSVNYLQTIGVLEKLRNAGFTVYVNESEVAEGNRLISYDGLSTQQLLVIETVRTALCDGLKAGRVIAAPTSLLAPEDRLEHPTVTVLQIEADVDAL